MSGLEGWFCGIPWFFGLWWGKLSAAAESLHEESAKRMICGEDMRRLHFARAI